MEAALRNSMRSDCWSGKLTFDECVTILRKAQIEKDSINNLNETTIDKLVKGMIALNIPTYTQLSIVEQGIIFDKFKNFIQKILTDNP